MHARLAGALLSIAMLTACAHQPGPDAATQPEAAPAPVPAPAAEAPAVPTEGSDLVLAARYGQVRTVRLLLDRGVDVNSRDALGRTALIAASGGNDVAGVIPLLIENGADLALRDKEGSDALTVAVINGRASNTDLLLDKGAPLEARGPNGETALMAAIRAGQAQMVDLLLDRGADPGTQTQEEFAKEEGAYTPLMVVARYGSGADGLRMLRQLVRHGANARLYRPNGETALTLAQRRGQQDMADDLRALGARDESPYAGLDGGRQLLQSIRLDDAGKAQELLDAGAPADYRDAATGVTPLASAAWHGRSDLLDMLLRGGARIDDVPRGLRAERIAVSSVPVAQRELMLAMARGDTALIIAARRGDEAMVKHLVEAGADVTVPNREGETPALVAARSGQTASLALFLKHGLDPDANAIPVRAAYLLTSYARGDKLGLPLVAAAGAGQAEAVTLLLDGGAKVDAADSGGVTALIAAAQGGHAQVVKLLLARGAQADARSAEGESALDLARRLGKDDVAAILARTP